MRNTADMRNRIRGCLIGGAAGDALGYPVEFLSEGRIWNLYGEQGITEYTADTLHRKALISDDTQMTLFTANGILVGDSQRNLQGNPRPIRDFAAYAYQDWLITQTTSYAKYAAGGKAHNISWLCNIPELFSRRAPGMTCLSALTERSRAGMGGDYILDKINDSKGCGGVMRVAPLGCYFDPDMDIEALDKEGAQIAAITHTHSLGYLPAAMLVHIVNRAVYSPEMSLLEIICEARDTVGRIFKDHDKIDDMTELVDLAVGLSQGEESDLDCIHMLGEGWTGEEALAIAIFCSLRYQNDFSGGIIAAVNHCGDSDSTGAVTGNILGALLGAEAIDSKWTEDLELINVTGRLADDLYKCSRENMGTEEWEPEWRTKYITEVMR